uniref:uncharacterized protein LOC120329972 n=1 Tax=Styela clava TaxID=7725 RepID=UPI00193A8933|nr:uncharacterized protein LOC120329972 [Styela clava]
MSTQARRHSVRTYHQGWMNVKQGHTYCRLYAQLMSGKELRFYQNETRTGPGAVSNCQFQVDLRYLTDVDMRSDRRAANAEYLIILKFKHQPEIKMRFQYFDDRAVWERYIRAAGLSKLPQKTENLLPGQIHEIKDIIENEENTEKQRLEQERQENQRRQTTEGNGSQTPDYTPMDPVNGLIGEETYPWYYPNIYARHDAEQILNENTGAGNMLIRRRQLDNTADEYDFAISTKTVADSNPFKHFKVKYNRQLGEYQIQLVNEKHPRLDSLESMIAYFETRSNNKYRRLSVAIETPSHLYEQRLFPGPNTPIYENELPGRPRHFSYENNGRRY